VSDPSDEIVNGLRLALYSGAARADATPEQLSRLQVPELILLLEEYKIDGDTAPVEQFIQKAMGLDWKPSGPWAGYLEALRKESN
jgi:hypothetical protein